MSPKHSVYYDIVSWKRVSRQAFDLNERVSAERREEARRVFQVTHTSSPSSPLSSQIGTDDVA